jgi:CBS domain-containing protein
VSLSLTREAIVNLLARHAPFDAQPPETLAAIADRAQLLDYAGDLAILVEDGPPAEGMWVVTEGSVELRHDGQSIQILEPGECFGHPSLLTRMPPAYTVRTREPTRCLWLDRSAAERVLGTTAGAAYVAATMRSRLVRQGHAVRGMLEVGTTPVSAIMRPARMIEPGLAVRDAVAMLSEPGVSALLVLPASGGRPEALVTDAVIRSALAARQLELDAPVASVARTPLVTVPIAQLAVEAAVDMLGAGVSCVAVEDAGTVVGTLSADDLLGLDARSPIALRHTFLGAADEDGLVRSVAHMPALFQHLVAAGLAPRDLGRVLSLQHDAIVTRLVDFSVSRHGPAPVPWAWLDLGSAARREFTLCSDQDNALAYAAPAAGEEESVDAYFERLGVEVNDGLARCGIGQDNNGVLAGSRPWRMTKAAWVRTFDECFAQPDESHLIRATVSFDFRAVAGSLAITTELVERIRVARGHPDFMRLMARTACGYPVALGRRGRLAAGTLDEPPGKLDLKRGAIIPLVNLVRYHALACGVTISPTLDRIEAVASVGQLDRETADALREAFSLVAGLRFEHHARLLAAGQPLDNLIDPGALPPVAAAELQTALQEVRRVQRRVEVLAGVR